MKKELNVLFIGNSYTNYNSLTTCFKKMVISSGYEVNVIKYAFGNQYIHNYINGENGDHFKGLQEIVENNNIDYAFVQGQSREPLVDYLDFFSSSAMLITYLKEHNITPILYQTWGYPVGYMKLMNDIGCKDTIDMANKLAIAYKSVADVFNLKISMVGDAFAKIFSNHLEKTDLLYAANDNSHPSSIGTYIAALSHFVTLYNDIPTKVKYTYDDYINDPEIVWHVGKVESIYFELQQEIIKVVTQVNRK